MPEDEKSSMHILVGMKEGIPSFFLFIKSTEYAYGDLTSAQLWAHWAGSAGCTKLGIDSMQPVK